MAGSYKEGPVGGVVRRPGGGGAQEEGAGRLAGQDGDLEGEDGPSLLSDSRLPSEGAEGKFPNFKNQYFFIEKYSQTFHAEVHQYKTRIEDFSRLTQVSQVRSILQLSNFMTTLSDD